MAEHRERRVLPYTPDEMFDLVADVEKYSEFLPWCSAVKVVSRGEKDGKEVVVADLFVSFKIHQERFRSEVTLDRAQHIILVRYIEGPFSYLNNEWRFSPAGEGAAQVDFHIDFEFKNRALRLLIGVVFGEAVRRMIGAFEARARTLYGRRQMV
jgi:coenzyme Q-binding protein COQ10